MPQKILIVDDDIDSLKLIGLMLKRQGYQVLAANTGGQALAKVAADLPDLVILDVMMPDMNGYEVCRRLRANADTRLIPIIMFTAKTLIDDKVAGFEAGADDYLTKPTHPAELVARVEAILERFPKPEVSGQQKGHVTGIFGVKGGLGATTLAVNLGIAAQQAGEQTIVLDYRLGASTMGPLIGITQHGNLAALVESASNGLDTGALTQGLITHRSGARFMLASSRLVEAQQRVDPDAALSLLDGLRGMSDNVVVDMGSTYTSDVQRLIDATDALILLVETSPSSMYVARNLLQTFQGKGQQLHIVVTQRQMADGKPPNWQDLETTIGHEVRAVLTAEAVLAQRAENTGQPILVMAPDSIYATQVKQLLHGLSVNSKASA